MSAEFFYFHEEGKRCDEALHLEMLESEAGQIASAAATVRLACARGTPLTEALAMYAPAELRNVVASRVA